MADMKIKLIYFDGRGRGEIIRQILAFGGIAFEDIRIPMEEWDDYKSKTPWGQLPILEFEGVTIAQTMTICRFVAKKAGLAGINALEQAQMDMVADKCNEYTTKLFDIHDLPTDELKAKASKKMLDDYVPMFLKNLDSLLEKSSNKFIGGPVPGYADIILAECINGLSDPKDPYIHSLMGDSRLKLVDKYPRIKDLTESVRSAPALKLYLDARRDSEKEEF
ncbi:hypothetical protein TCAL_07392 [Tigriopus californicus]|uniref:glutathione transferase n=1 Tax=Tigriopus californicus TaxID=6832 RepID=A0A553P6E8_TIGCA|nr:hematopoietic prostaglandin D synthase-like [Tigriopus californicus]TRY73251.1 hypothetical protein TCAL_07392 [Tigriopus californicus]|eukprot:TCALIF_07392-PA protein Name:"Similar to HPGDS Hematopoietic prostaglandin D synthase (Gallus gallus)" AED:0.44 eAED:0.44 QI:103/1/0.75/1/1/1/4/0/220